MRTTFYVRLFVLFATISAVLCCGSSSGGGGSRSGGSDSGGGFFDGLFGDNDDDINTGDDDGEGDELPDGDLGGDNPDNGDGNGEDGGFLGERFGGFLDGLFEDGDGTDDVDDNVEDGGFLGALFGGDDDDDGVDMATSLVSSARNFIGSTRYSTSSSYGPGSGQYKCNYFVHDILESVGAPAPERRSRLIPGSYPISAETWGDRNTPKEGFQLVGSNPSDARPGDVASDGQHVGIVSREGHTISASSRENKVVENEWGFRDTDDVLFWRPLAEEQK